MSSEEKRRIIEVIMKMDGRTIWSEACKDQCAINSGYYSESHSKDLRVVVNHKGNLYALVCTNHLKHSGWKEYKL